MAMYVQLVEGRWYQDANGEKQQVALVDEKDMLFEVRFEDGRTERYPLAAWRELELVATEDHWVPGHSSDGLSNEEYRRATGWAEKSPDDFSDG